MLEVFLARRYLSSHHGRGLSAITWIALAGVIVGVMSLVTVLSVMSGFEKELRTRILGNNAHFLIRSHFPVESQSLSEALNRIRGVESVDSAMKVIHGEAFLLGKDGGAEGSVVKAVETSDVREVLDLEKYIENGNWEGFEKGQIILGKTLALRLGITPGDSVTLLLNEPDLSPLGVMPKMKRLQVADVFHSGMSQYDGGNAYLPLELGRELFSDEPIQIEVRAKNVDLIPKTKAELREKLSEDYQIFDWLYLNKDFLSALQLEKLVMAVILGLIILVAAFNICGSLIMIVRDKTKDIAILKSMGGDRKLVQKIFLLQGLFIGGFGTVVGLILGVVLSLVLRDQIQFPLNPQVYMIDRVPVDIRISDLILVSVGALLISLGATLYPAQLAAGLEPTEGLKVE